jgi:FlaA1/EpsC-like NDP-sugar epimerase
VFTPWRVLLYGAGDAGLLSLRELRQNPERGLKPIGFIDDDPKSKAFKCKVCTL